MSDKPQLSDQARRHRADSSCRLRPGDEVVRELPVTLLEDDTKVAGDVSKIARYLETGVSQIGYMTASRSCQGTTVATGKITIVVTGVGASSSLPQTRLARGRSDPATCGTRSCRC